MEVKLYQIEVNHHLMSHRWRCCSLLSTAPPAPSPHGRNKGNFNSCDVMWGAIGTLHIDICYMLQLLRCCCSIVHCHYQWTVFCDNWELSQPMFYFRRQQSVCHNDGDSDGVWHQPHNIIFSAVNCPNVHCSYKHVSPPNLSSSIHKSLMFSLMSPHPAASSMRRGQESWDPHIRCSRHRVKIQHFLSSSPSPANTGKWRQKELELCVLCTVWSGWEVPGTGGEWRQSRRKETGDTG